MGLLHDWLEAIDAEKQVRGSFAPLASEIKTLAEVRTYLAWRQALPAETRDRTIPQTEQEADRLRYDLARRLTNLVEENRREEAERKEQEEKLIVGEEEERGEKNY
ncbi:MAG: hypothetical protein ACOYB4_05210 [Methyloceanibacter sp.]